MRLSRRETIAAMLAAMAMGPVRSSWAADALAAKLSKTVSDFVAMGDHRTATEADVKFSAETAQKLQTLGLSVERQEYFIPQFFPDRADLTIGGETLMGFPQWPAKTTSATGLSGQLWVPGGGDKPENAIALVKFPYRPQAVIKPYASIVTDAISAGAAAVVAITEGPTGELIAMNAPLETPQWPVPVFLIGSKHTAKLSAAAAERHSAKLTVTGRHDPKARAYNTIARLDDGKPETIVVSTPASGWFQCGGERGPGIAIFMALAEWARSKDQKFNWIFINTSGHELGHAGMDYFLDNDPRLPSIEACRLWVHLGACIATYDFAEANGALKKLATPLNRRFLTGNEDMVPELKTAFGSISNFPNIDAHRLTEGGGELRTILPKTNFKRAITFFGGSYYFHTPLDGADQTGGDIIAPVAEALMRYLEAL